MLKIITAFLFVAFSTMTVAQGLPQNDEFYLIDPLPTSRERSLTTIDLDPTQEATFTRYVDKMLDRDPTDADLAYFALYMYTDDCSVFTLGFMIWDIYTGWEFQEILPATSQPWSRAGKLVRRVYKAALARAPDTGGFTFYRNKLVNGEMTEDDFVFDIIASQEFDEGIAEWCGE